MMFQVTGAEVSRPLCEALNVGVEIRLFNAYSTWGVRG